MISRITKALFSKQLINNTSVRLGLFSSDGKVPDAPTIPNDRKQQIQQILKTNKYVLFMKGCPEMPMCGYSNFAVEILKFYKIQDFKSVDIFKDSELRQQVKQLSEWPTFPQFYINGKLIGGCDIMHELHKQGKLKAMLQ